MNICKDLPYLFYVAVVYLQERFYFSDHVLPCFETGMPLLKQRLHQLPDADDVSTYTN